MNNNWNEGEWVLSWGINTLQDKKTGKRVRVSYHTAGIIVNGKIARLHYWYNRLNVLGGQGFEINHPSN